MSLRNEVSMSMDKEQLEEFFERIVDRYTPAELIEILEDAGLVDIWTIIAFLEDELIEARGKLEV